MADTTSGGMIEWLKNNPTITIGGGLILVLIIAGKMMQPKSPASSTPNADLSGLQNGNLVYVPTQTSFTTVNKTQSGVFASNDPQLTTITGPVNSPAPKPPVPAPKPPVPAPPGGHRAPPPPPPKPVEKYPIPGKSPFAYRFGERVFQWKDPYGHLWTVGFGPSGRVWGVPGVVSDTQWQNTPIPPKTLLYQD